MRAGRYFAHEAARRSRGTPNLRATVLMRMLRPQGKAPHKQEQPARQRVAPVDPHPGAGRASTINIVAANGDDSEVEVEFCEMQKNPPRNRAEIDVVENHRVRPEASRTVCVRCEHEDARRERAAADRASHVGANARSSGAPSEPSPRVEPDVEDDRRHVGAHENSRQ